MTVQSELKTANGESWHNYRRAALLIFGAFGLYFIYLAVIFKVNYYDSFEYLNSAKALLNIGGYYDYSRPPVLPLMLTPILALSRLFTGQWWLSSSPYFYMLIISGLSLWFCYRCWRDWQGPEIALILTLLLLLDRVFFHFVLFALPDIFSTALVCGIVYYTYRVTITERTIDAAMAGLVLGLSVSTKHYLAPLCLVPTIFLFTEWFRFEGARFQFQPSIKQIKWLSIIAAVSAIVTVSLHRITFWLIAEYRHQSLIDILRQVVEKGRTVNEMQTTFSAFSSLQSLYMIVASIGWPLLIMAIVGILIALRRPTRLQLLIFLWLTIFLMIFIFIFGRREARYFLQATPALLFFAGVTIKEILNFPSEKWRKLIIAGSTVLVLGSLMIGTVKEINIFTDPIFQNNALQRLAVEVEQQTQPDNKIIWFGELLAVMPEHSALIEDQMYDDPLYNLYGSHGNGLNYYTERKAYTFLFPLRYPPDLTSALQPGDLLLFTPSVPVTNPPFPPITFHRFTSYTVFTPEQTANSDGSVRFKAQDNSANLSIAAFDGGLRIFGTIKTPLFGWEFLKRGEKPIPFKGFPLFSLPISLALQKPIDPKSIDSVVTVPIPPAYYEFYR